MRGLMVPPAFRFGPDHATGRSTAAIWNGRAPRKSVVGAIACGYWFRGGAAHRSPKMIANPAHGGILRMDDVRERFPNLQEFLKVTRFKLNRNNWDYIVGGTETETTLARNRQSLDSIAFKPRVLRNVQNVDCSTELYGRKMRLPVLIAPRSEEHTSELQ